MEEKTAVLTAISTLITFSSILYSLWYTDINEAKNMVLADFEEDRNKSKRKLKCILISKCIPLFVITFVIVTIFTPQCIIYIKNWSQDFSSEEALITLSIILINIFIFVLLLVTGVMTFKIIKKLLSKGK